MFVNSTCTATRINSFDLVELRDFLLDQTSCVVRGIHVASVVVDVRRKERESNFGLVLWIYFFFWVCLYRKNYILHRNQLENRLRVCYFCLT